MTVKFLALFIALALAGLVLTACASSGEATAVPPTAAPTAVASGSLPTASPTTRPTANTPMTQPVGTDATKALQPQTAEAANVTVKVTPLSLKSGEPPVFDIAMDTHSVDLASDMLKTVVLRDDAGTENAPVSWDGAGPGGHHRQGKIKFATLTTNPKSITLVLKNVAGIAERRFQWDVAW